LLLVAKMASSGFEIFEEAAKELAEALRMAITAETV
jgi:hypothetical protein